MKARFTVALQAGLVAASIALGNLSGLAQTVGASPPPSGLQNPGYTALDQAPSNTWFDQLFRLAQAGTGDQVMFSFIDSAGRFELNADRIVALKNVGASEEVIVAALNHDQYFGGVGRAESIPEPAPPVKLVFVKPTPEVLATIKPPAVPDPNRHPPGTPPRSIVNHLDEDSLYPDADYSTNYGFDESQNEQPAPGRYPVRAPYSVRLTDPIVVISPMYLRTPNLVVLRSF